MMKSRALRVCRSAVAAGSVAVVAATLGVVAPGIVSGAPDTGALAHCEVPAAGSAPTQQTPEQLGVTQAGVDQAIAFATSRLRSNIQIYRNNCLIGRGPLNDRTDALPWNLWSSTKSVVAMVAGVAVTQGLLDIDAPIDRYVPAGLGDAAHRSVTARQLLNQNSGVRQSAVAEAVTSGLDIDTNIIEQELALPIEHAPGTFFEYSQHGPDLLAYVIENAVSQDLQQYAQDNLFGPLGIDSADYHWGRDRSGNTYGYAFLFMAPKDFSRLGLLMVNDGVWRDSRIISSSYVEQFRTPSQTNPCYGFLTWLNQGPCTGPSVPSRQTLPTAPLQGLPADAYAMVGLGQQNNFIIPSLGMMVTWTGLLGDVSPDPSTLLSANPDSELYRSFFRILGAGFTNPPLPDPGPYTPTFNLTLDPPAFFDPNFIAGAVGIGPFAPEGCNAFSCGSTPLRPPLEGAEGCLVITCLPSLPEVFAPNGRPGS